MSHLAPVLRKLVDASGKSDYQFYKDSGLDPSNARRLLTGERDNPEFLTVIRAYIGAVGDSALLENDVLAEGLSALMAAWLKDAAALAAVHAAAGSSRVRKREARRAIAAEA